MVFHLSLRDNKSPQISRTLLSIPADLNNNAVVKMDSTRPFISKSSNSFIHPSMTVPRAPVMIDINVTFMFHIFFNFLARKKKLNDNYTRILRAVLNKSCKEQPTKQSLYIHLFPISQTIQVRRTRRVGKVRTIS